MTNLENNAPPQGHMWAENLASKARQDVAAIISLCEQEIIQGVKIEDRWAIRVVRTTTTQAGTAIVRDLKAGGDISIGSVIGQYHHVVVIDGKDREKDKKQFFSQKPIRQDIDTARKWIKWSWYALAGGAAFFIVGTVFVWPIAAFIIIPGAVQSVKALNLAKEQGDTALIEDARAVNRQATIMAFVLWGVLILVGLIAIASS